MMYLGSVHQKRMAQVDCSGCTGGYNFISFGEHIYLFSQSCKGSPSFPSQVSNFATSRCDPTLVFNNVGYVLIGPLEALTDEQIQMQVQTNLFGVINVTRAFFTYFRERRSGMFINITSTFGLLGYPTCSIYNAAKFAVDGFSEGLSYEFGPIRD